jgi:hypothetical protein
MCVLSKPDIPSHWLKGQLLDLRRFTDGSYRATLLGDEDDTKSGYVAPRIDFASSHEAQSFVSAWYTPAQQVR